MSIDWMKLEQASDGEGILALGLTRMFVCPPKRMRSLRLEPVCKHAFALGRQLCNLW